MTKESPNVKVHLFICTSCTYKTQCGNDSNPEEAVQLRRNLKNQVREKLSKKEVKVSAVSCLGECEQGIAGVFYPDNEWHLNLLPHDEEKLFELISDKYAQVK